jgi:hypothetical protein
MTIFGVQEDNRLAMGADLGDRAEGLDSLGHQVIKGLVDVIDLDTDMMNATRLVLVEESLDGGVLTVRMEKLDLGVAQLYEHCVHSVLGERL